MTLKAGHHLPSILVTGASGFIGRNFLEAAKNQFRIYAMSRAITDRSSIPKHPNIEWIDVDIGNFFYFHSALSDLRLRGGVDYILHLASFYDFNYDENPEYIRTNLVGTKNVLEEARRLNIKRFIFASSLAACDFSQGGVVNEQSPADADFRYAITKREGEELLKSYSNEFPCTIARFAAAFSDWCEYGPLYVFLNTWLSRNWKSRILGGKGQSAITYLHVSCLVRFLLRIITISHYLPRIGTYIASPNEPVSHLELFNVATRFYFGKTIKPVFMPKPVATLGVHGMDLLGRVTGKKPFERPWMMRYVDKQLRVDSSQTRNVLDWEPVERYKLPRRLLFIIEHMKSYPYEWHNRNTKMLKSLPVRSNFLIYEGLEKVREKVVERITAHLISGEDKNRFLNYRQLHYGTLQKDLITVYQFLSASIRAHDRMSMLAYARQLAFVRFRQGFPFEEVREVISAFGRIVQEELKKVPLLDGMDQLIYDEVSISFQLMIDELEGGYEDAEKELAVGSSASYTFREDF
jgi:nucleoside-diphosphate-sugar epimerase